MFKIQRIVVVLLVLSGSLLGCKEDEILSPQEQFAYDVNVIRSYVSENGINATEHDSGLFYEIHEQGTGEFANLQQYVTVNYEGRILGETSAFDEGRGKSFKLDELITGWQIGLPLIQEGGSITLYIPSFYGFGSVSSTSIPGNSILEFDIDFLSIGCNEIPDVENVDPAQLTADLATIDQYLLDHNIIATEHESGLRYVVNNEGQETDLTLCNAVRVNYSGHLLDDPTILDANTNVSFKLRSLVLGWQIGLPLIHKGGSATLYIPSGLGYGPDGAGSVIPENAILVFDVDLIEVL